jgi:hypothetical protein
LAKLHAKCTSTSSAQTAGLARIGCVLTIGVLLGLTLLISACGPGTETGEAPVQPTRDERKDQPPLPLSNFSAAGLKSGEVEVFLQTLKDAVARGDARVIASMVAYPITVSIDGEPVSVKTPEAFVANYPDIMSEPIKQAVEKAQSDRLFVNYRGVRLGRGEVWFGGVYKDDQEAYQVKILAINN